MTDYKKMAEDAQREFQTKLNAEREAQEAADARKRSEFEKAAQLLKRVVAPQLERAATAFREQGIEAEVIYDLAMLGPHHQKPSISFFCLGPKRRSDGHQFKSAGVCFETDLQNIVTRPSDVVHTGIIAVGRSAVSTCEDLVVSSVRAVLDHYHTALDRYNKSGADRI